MVVTETKLWKSLAVRKRLLLAVETILLESSQKGKDNEKKKTTVQWQPSKLYQKLQEIKITSK